MTSTTLVLLIAVVSVTVVAMLVWMSRKVGVQTERARTAAKHVERGEKANAVDKAVDKLSPSAKRDKLRKRKRK